jgi:hypothetical protein
MVNKFIGEVDAALFGDGYTIRLDMDGLAKLDTEFGEFDFVQKVQIGLAVLSAKYIRAFLAVSLRDADGNPAVRKAAKEAAHEEIPPDVPLDVIARKCLDAFSLFRYGKDHETWAAETTAAKAATANPTKGTKA